MVKWVTAMLKQHVIPYPGLSWSWRCITCGRGRSFLTAPSASGNRSFLSNFERLVGVTRMRNFFSSRIHPHPRPHPRLPYPTHHFRLTGDFCNHHPPPPPLNMIPPRGPRHPPRGPRAMQVNMQVNRPVRARGPFPANHSGRIARSPKVSNNPNATNSGGGAGSGRAGRNGWHSRDSVYKVGKDTYKAVGRRGGTGINSGAVQRAYMVSLCNHHPSPAIY